jgi:hypothetical protein
MAKKTKFLDPKDVDEAVAEAAEAARLYRIDAAIVGGVAMAVYGSDRLTKDVNVACRDECLPGMKEVKPLAFGGSATVTPKGHPLDVIVRSDDYRDLYIAAIENARDEGLALPVVSPEYLAAMKMAAGRDKDKIDLKALIRLGVLDLNLTKAIVRTHLGRYAVKVFDSVCAEVEWLRSQER